MFARDGYAATSLEAVVAACGLTKGAFYHHFDSKQELFDAVFEREQETIARSTWAAYESKADPGAAALAAARAFFDISLDAGVQQITLLDAPSVLGWDRMRQIESRYGLLMMKEAIRSAKKAKRLARRDVDALAHLLFGALCEGAMYVTRADDTRAARRKVEREFKAIVDALGHSR